MFLLQLVYYGDLVIPTPAWVSYAPQARIIGRHVRFVATERTRRLAAQPRRSSTRCAGSIRAGRGSSCSTTRPTRPARTYNAAELEELADVASAEPASSLLSDEIYGELHHEGEHRSIVPLYPQGTIFSGGLSKWCGAGGWRLGLFVVPARACDWLLRRDGGGRERDLHLDLGADPVRGRPRVPARPRHRPVPRPRAPRSCRRSARGAPTTSASQGSTS